METVKTLLENTKQDLEMKLWWAKEHDKEPQFINEIPVLKQKISDIDEVLLRLFSVGRSKKLVCRHDGDDNYRKDEDGNEWCNNCHTEI